MRRLMIEWLTIASMGIFLVIVTLLAASLQPSWSSSPLEVAHNQWGNGVAYVQVQRGVASVFSEVDFDAVPPVPYVANPRTLISPRATTNYQFAIPGLAFQFCRFVEGPPVWSVSVSLVYLAVLSLIVAVLLIRRWRRVLNLATGSAGVDR